MGIRLQDIPTVDTIALTDKVLVTDGTGENLITVNTLKSYTSILFQGTRSSQTTLVGDASMVKCALTGTGIETPPLGGSGMSLSQDGGVNVSVAGTYKVTASLYLHTNTNANGVYIFYGTSFRDGQTSETGAEELIGTYDAATKSSVKQIVGIASVAAGTNFYLIGRASTTDTTAGYGWLMVERLA